MRCTRAETSMIIHPLSLASTSRHDHMLPVHPYNYKQKNKLNSVIYRNQLDQVLSFKSIRC